VADHTADEWFDSILASAQTGDPRAFDALVRWLERPLLGFTRAQGARDPEDLVNEALVRVFRGIGRFDGNAAQFRAWVFRIARNLVIDAHRRSQRSGRLELTATGEVPDLPALPEISPLEQAERIAAMLAVLTTEQREVLLLRVLGGLSVEETAAVIGKRQGAVRALQHRALRVLERELSRRT
jgi:RNA polymerase sigma-70 factor (ECF subfamily)